MPLFILPKEDFVKNWISALRIKMPTLNPNAPAFDPIQAQAEQTSREVAETALEGEENKPLGQGRRRKSRKSRTKKSKKSRTKKSRRRGGGNCGM